MFRNSSQQGFTLLELLTVIAIIGILSSTAVVSFESARSKARDAKRISEAKAIQTALTLYYDDIGYYPRTPPAAGQPLAVGQIVYIQKWPADPIPAQSYTYTPYPTGCDNNTRMCEDYDFVFYFENPNKDLGAMNDKRCTISPESLTCS